MEESLPAFHIILQARTNSSRLPGKVLLLLAGMPIALLAARRASNTGAKLVIATSTEPDDDYLAEIVTAAGFRVVRGPLINVLSRFMLAAEDLPDEAIIARLTADNVLPDGHFLASLYEDMIARELDYLGTDSPADGLPYGLSAELFTMRALRYAASHALSDFDREHVTPTIKRKFGTARFEAYRESGQTKFWPAQRATIDRYNDYQRMLALFSGIDDPIAVPWSILADRLAALPEAPRFILPMSEIKGEKRGPMILGTAQLGLNYGITNRAGQPSFETTKRLLRLAIEHGINEYDTAHAYGDSEERLGAALFDLGGDKISIVTKLAPFDNWPDDTDAAILIAATDASVFASLAKLRAQRIDTLLLHRAGDYYRGGGALWHRLLAHQREGRIRRLGVSVQNPSELLPLLSDSDIGYVQLPFNILDWRWAEAGVPQALTNRSDLVVVARSALLQGLLVLNTSIIWPCDHSLAIQTQTILKQAIKNYGCVDAIDLALAYVRSHSWIDGLVVGVDSEDQLLVTMRYFLNAPLSNQTASQLAAALPRIPESLLNPSQWPKSDVQ